VSRRAAFLDRDGTINVLPPEHQYVTRPEDFELLPGAIEGMARLAGCGYTLVIASNQRGVGRGLVSEEALRACEAIVREALSPHGARVAGYYYCPHLIEDECDCRKPQPGLLLRAARELDLDLGASWMVGDSATDVEAGAAAGCSTAYVGSEAGVTANVTAASLGAAAAEICAGG
jgi:D-glycero-D-manno-heptose 1,7-bisphosphate phosphatase